MAASILARPTLVLNRNWQPINVATVARALVMLWNGSVRVVDPRDYQLYDWHDWAQLVPSSDELCVRAPATRLRVPEVITVCSFDRVPTARVTFSRRNVFKRDKYTCQYCNIQPGTEELTIDHILPRSMGGQSTWTNCVLACVRCNSRKADRTPEQAGMHLRRPPVRPKWRPIYADHPLRIESWAKFMDAAYWNSELDK